MDANSSDQFIDRSSDTNKENITLIWFDPNIGSYEETKEQLRLINDYVIFVTDLGHCIQLIQSIEQDKIFLITSGSKATFVLSKESLYHKLDSIFIYSFDKTQYEYLLDDYSKIIGIYATLDELYRPIKEQINFVNQQIEEFFFCDQNEKLTNKLSKQSAAFIWLQLLHYVITRLPQKQQERQQMIELCKDYYRENTKEIQSIETFDKTYQSKDALLWYSKQSFIYRLLNKALRTKDIGHLNLFRFFINDLSQGIQKEYKEMLSSKQKILDFYRGMKLNKDNFEKFKENKGKLMSINGYVLASQRKSVAINIAMKSTKRNNIIPVLFHIQCDIEQRDNNSTFATISQFSNYPAEQEVLFNLNTCFLIESIEEHSLLTTIKISLSNEGKKIAHDYLVLKQKETEKPSVSITFGRLLCDFNEYDKSLKYFRELLDDTYDQDRAWVEFNIGRVFELKGELKQAQTYYNLAYDRMKRHQPARVKDTAHVLNNIGVLLYRQGDYDEALNYHERSLTIRVNYYRPNHIDVANSLNNIGNIFNVQGKYKKGLDYHRQALKIQQKYYQSNHTDVGDTLNNIGASYLELESYEEALDYCKQALEVREKFYPSGHIDIARNQTNVALALFYLGRYDEALDYYQRALETQEKHYPSGHIDIASTLNNIGACYEESDKKVLAVDYYKRSLTVYEKFLPADNSKRQKTENNVRRLIQENN